MRFEDYIEIRPGIRSGKPCFKGTRITVYDVLEYLAGGTSEAQLLEEFPALTREHVRAAGRPSRRVDWQIGVRDPFDRSSIIGKIALPSGMAVSTSGSYERFVDILGQRFSHIIDPRTGYPVTETASVTVLCNDAVTADALSTAFFVAGLKEAPKILKTFTPSVDLLLVPDRYPTELWLTPGFAKVLTSQNAKRLFPLSNH